MDQYIPKAIISSATEAELGALFLNATNVVSMRNILLDMGHSQPPTPIKTDNRTALGVVTNTIKRKRTIARVEVVQYATFRTFGAFGFDVRSEIYK